ncbi:MAG TPA: GntR family transcriptional regulator [Casimicrobiaceae bacterium]|nr:GntR family transcriptional regulator [Casimicrobiaceae bacterium]
MIVATVRDEPPSLSSTTASRVADELRRRILNGEFAPGQRLKIDELAELFDVSHMPIREALRELAGEGVLEVHPHRGAVIHGVDRRFVRNFYDVRAAIEAMLAARCAERSDATVVALLKEAATRFEAAGGDDSQGRVKADRRFHHLMNAAADNPQALRMLSQGRLLAEAMRLRFGYGGGRVEAIVAEHRALVRAIERHDADRAGEIARRHVQGARDDLLRQLTGVS